MREKPKVCIIGCGGTISATYSGMRVWKPGVLTAVELTKYVPLLGKVAEIQTMDLFRDDSSNMQPEDWSTLAQTIFLKLKDYDGIVVTHGTDTMHYTAAAISFMIQNLNKPIVFTGAQFALTQAGSDGKRNLFDAARVAAETDIGESVIVFNGKIIRGNRAKKFKEIEFDAFDSVGMDPLGKVENSIMLYGEHIRKKNTQPLLLNKVETNVSLIKMYPGFKPKTIETMIDNDAKGFVIEGYGAGNVPTGNLSIIPLIKRAVESGIPVVITTQCTLGTSWVYLYEVGRKALDAGGIPGFDLLSETALVKLMWVLGQTKNISKVKEMMHKNYCGEITPEVRTVEQKTLFKKQKKQ